MMGGITAAAVPNGVGLPAQPALAIANNLNKLAFWDDFSSPNTIDSGQTLLQGFNWYTSHMRSDGVHVINVPNNGFTVSNSVVDINQENPSGGYAFYTAAVSQYGPTNYIGHTFKPPFYIECKIAVNKSLAPGALGPVTFNGTTNSRYSWPTIWLNDVTLTLAQFTPGGTTTQSYAEVDVIEFYVSTAGMGAGVWDMQANIHIWDTPTTISPDSTNHVNWGVTWDDATYHVIGFLITSASAIWYFDGTLMQTVSTAGNFAPAFNSNYLLLINPGYGTWPIHIDYVQIWQA